MRMYLKPISFWTTASCSLPIGAQPFIGAPRRDALLEHLAHRAFDLREIRVDGAWRGGLGKQREGKHKCQDRGAGGSHKKRTSVPPRVRRQFRLRFQGGLTDLGIARFSRGLRFPTRTSRNYLGDPKYETEDAGTRRQRGEEEREKDDPPPRRREEEAKSKPEGAEKAEIAPRNMGCEVVSWKFKQFSEYIRRPVNRGRDAHSRKQLELSIYTIVLHVLGRHLRSLCALRF